MEIRVRMAAGRSWFRDEMGSFEERESEDEDDEEEEAGEG